MKVTKEMSKKLEVANTLCDLKISFSAGQNGINFPAEGWEVITPSKVITGATARGDLVTPRNLLVAAQEKTRGEIREYCLTGSLYRTCDIPDIAAIASGSKNAIAEAHKAMEEGMAKAWPEFLEALKKDLKSKKYKPHEIQMVMAQVSEAEPNLDFNSQGKLRILKLLVPTAKELAQGDPLALAAWETILATEDDIFVSIIRQAWEAISESYAGLIEERTPQSKPAKGIEKLLEDLKRKNVFGNKDIRAFEKQVATWQVVDGCLVGLDKATTRSKVLKAHEDILIRIVSFATDRVDVELKTPSGFENTDLFCATFLD